MKVKKLLFTFLLFLSSCDVLVTTSNNIESPSSNTNTNNSSIDIKTINLQLNDKNKPIEALSSSNFFTSKIDEIDFNYSNAFYTSDDNHISLAKNGFITNKLPFGKLLSFSIEYCPIINNTKQNEYGFGYLKYRISNTFIDNPNDYGVDITTFQEKYTVNLEDKEINYISLWTPRVVNIKSLTFTYTNNIYIEPEKTDFTIQVISTNDLHGQVKATDYYPGLSSLTTKMKQVAANNDQYNIFLDQGDIYQGTAEAGLSYGYNMDDFLLLNGYESTTLGNHEFDWGYNRIAMHDEYLSIPILANNVRYDKDNTSPSWASPYKLISRNGVKIGIIGAIGNVESSISASKIPDTYFLTGSSLTNQIKKDSQTLKNMGADFIILSLHDGGNSSTGYNSVSNLSYYDISSLSDNYVDLVLEGHTHQKYSFYDSKGVWHVQNNGNGGSFSVSKIKCTYNKITDNYDLSVIGVDQYTNNNISLADDDIAFIEIDNWYSNNYYGLIQNEVIGKNVPYISSTELRQIAANEYFKYGLTKTNLNDSQRPILGGGFFSVRPPYQINGGIVKYGDIYSIFPFENDLVLCSISGYNLKTKFLESSKLNDTYYIATNITSSDINNNSTYYILTDTYSSDYSYNGLTVIKNFTIEDGVYCRDLVAQYFRDNYL